MNRPTDGNSTTKPRERFDLRLHDLGDPLVGANRPPAYRLKLLLRFARRRRLGLKALWPPAQRRDGR
jgi:hypothetical protein